MNKVELLAPAGSFESLIAAVNNGADAVYLGGSLFSARAHAQNFNSEEIVEAIKYCHLRDVKVYITLNTLYSDKQFPDLIAYLDFLYSQQIDAVLVQDLGLMKVIRERYPDLDLHVSTQASVYNVEAINFFQSLGAKRVVLARENTIEEIKYIKENTDLEIEVFIHGALCMSYSGQCLMSSIMYQRSGNKGDCAQPCRLPYSLIKDNQVISSPEYLLSPKDLCTIDYLSKLLAIGVDSLKIEGRMKRPEYVATVVHNYHQAILDYYRKNKRDYQKAKLAMQQMFNREYTTGFIFQPGNFITKDIPGNRGLPLGKVVHDNKHKKRIVFKLDADLAQGDRILFPKYNYKRTITKLYKNGLLVREAKAGDIVEIELDKTVKNGDLINKLSSIKLLKAAQKSYEKEHKQIPVTMALTGNLNQKLELTLTQGKNIIRTKSKDIIQEAKNQALTKERITQQLSKLGNTIYFAENIRITFPDNGTIAIKELNDIRRRAIQNLTKLREEQVIHHYSLDVFKPTKKPNHCHLKNLIVYLNDLNQLKICQNIKGIDFIYPLQADLKEALAINPNLTVAISYLNNKDELLQFKNSSLYPQIKSLLVSDFRGLELFNDKKLILNYNFNIYNSYAAELFKDYSCIYSIEMTREMINNSRESNNIVFLYGKTTNMVLKHCIISQHYFGKKIPHCNKCKTGNFKLRNQHNQEFCLETDHLCNNYILNDQPIAISDISNLKVRNGLLSFSDEDPFTTLKIINYYRDLLENKRISFDFNHTKGYLG